jgi:ABC-type Fe3+-siderophore transport system permease subunit
LDKSISEIMSYETKPRWKQRLGGLFLMLLGGGFSAWGWYTAINEGYYYRKANMLFPAVFILGFGLLMFPGYKEERIARGEDISGLSGIKLLTPRWWAILIVALIAGFGNYLILSYM